MKVTFDQKENDNQPLEIGDLVTRTACPGLVGIVTGNRKSEMGLIVFWLTGRQGAACTWVGPRYQIVRLPAGHRVCLEQE